jgi:hypothetical protein
MRQIYEYHPVIGFRFVPRLRARVPHEGGGYLVRTNETGFRSDHPFAARKPADGRRILLFGDSFTAGDGVSNGHRYGDWCERQVPGLEVFNFGLPATGLDQHHLIYREYAQDIEHDVLVIGVFVENIRRVGSRYRHFHDDSGKRVLYAKPYYTLEGDALRLHGVPPPRQPVDEAALRPDAAAHVFTRERFPRLKAAYNRLRRDPRFDRWVVDSGLKDRLLRLARYQPIKEYDDPRHPAWQVMDALLQQWIREHGRPVVVVPIPLRHYVDGIADASAYQARLRSATEAAGGRFFDPLPGLRALPAGTRKALYFAGDGHLTRAGHEALGHLLAAYLAAQPELGKTP